MNIDGSGLVFYEPYTIWYNPFWKSWWFILLMGLMFFVVLIGIVVVIVRYVGERSPYKRIVARIKGLNPHEKNPKSFYDALTAIMKQYAIKRFNLMQTGVTDTEFVELLKNNSQFPAALHTDLDAIYEGILHIKFADSSVQKNNMKAAQEAALRIIEATKK